MSNQNDDYSVFMTLNEMTEKNKKTINTSVCFKATEEDIKLFNYSRTLRFSRWVREKLKEEMISKNLW